MAVSAPAVAREPDGELRAQADAPLGGQAVLEGVMMRGVSNWAVAVRKPSPAQAADGELHADEAALGEVEVSSFPLDSALRRHRLLRLPIVRGVVALGGSLAIGFKALEVSANAQLAPAPKPAPPTNEPPADQLSADGAGPYTGTLASEPRLAAGNGAVALEELSVQGPRANGATALTAAHSEPLERANGAAPLDVGHTDASAEQGSEDIPKAVWAGTIVVSLVLAIVLFFLIPVGLTSLIKKQLGSAVLFWIVEGLIRTTLFLAYMVALSRVKDLRRVFEYHGAEHKTISCYEAGLELTPENATRFSRLHPRCGTSFLLIVMIVAIFVFPWIGLPAWYWLLLTRILGVPLIAGISFEIIKFAGRNRNRGWVRALMWPGLKLQLLTTREPDLSQLEVAIAALKAVLAHEKPGELSAADLVGVEVVA